MAINNFVEGIHFPNLGDVQREIKDIDKQLECSRCGLWGRNGYQITVRRTGTENKCLRVSVMMYDQNTFEAASYKENFSSEIEGKYQEEMKKILSGILS